MSHSATDRQIRTLRPPKESVDPHKANGWLIEEERRPDGTREKSLTIFLTGAECPFTCSFCDLWRSTLDGGTPPGALPEQITEVLGVAGPADRIKLYNASNFFDPRAVPPGDVGAIARLTDSFGAVTVESHAHTIDNRALAFACEIAGKLEVAIGLETIHPSAATRLNKRLDLARFEIAARFLADHGIDLRVFVLLGAPHIPASDCVDWTVRTVDYAVGVGAAVVSIVPVRGGNGELERLMGVGAFVPPTLAQLEDTIDACARFRQTVVTADLWDIDRLVACDHCGPERKARLERWNLTGVRTSRITCDACGAM